MMVQTVKRKKKGRPPKADPLPPTSPTPDSPALATDLRRSLRRRKIRSKFDSDDYIYDHDGVDEEEEEERSSEKKFKLKSEECGVDSWSDGYKYAKEREIDGEYEIDGNLDEIDDSEVRRGNKKGTDSIAGASSQTPQGIPLPDKKSLLLILDKLQKKDKYSVFAQPVDPEELPDYHDVIEHPMDFATVRKKLANGLYFTLEQFESDVFLICSNAMKYNAPNTIYHKKARAIRDLASTKFQRLRIDIECFDSELKVEQNKKSNSTIAAPRNLHHGPNAGKAGGSDRPTNANGTRRGYFSSIDSSLDKAEDLLYGNGLPSKFSRKQFEHEEHHCTTNNIFNHSAVESESILTMLSDEVKQLVAVGLHADHSYARSLARFAATLGPVAWKIASRRIERALPPGVKFGLGWVGEYEPLPKPLLLIDNSIQREPTAVTNLHSTLDARKDDRSSKAPITATVSAHSLDGTSSLYDSRTKSTLTLRTSVPVGGVSLEGKPSFTSPSGSKYTITMNGTYQQKNPQSWVSRAENKVLEQVELNSPSLSNQKSSWLYCRKADF